MKRPETPAIHGILDYVFTGIQMFVPPLIGMNKTASRTHQALGAGYTIVNLLTDTPAGAKKVIPFKTHQKADLAFIAGTSALTFFSFIRKDRRALAFHLAFLATAVAHYCLTDYND